MDSKSIIAEKIENYLEEKSKESDIDKSLKADPSEIEYYNFGGDGGYLRKNICKITVNHSDSGTYEPCHTKDDPYGANQTWKCGIGDGKGDVKNKSICFPHRRERLCTYNLEKLNVEKIRDNNSFLADVLLTARNEGEKIILNHQDTNSSNVCVALERSFADIADIIRGTDQLKGATNNILKQKVKQMFEKILEKDKALQDKYPKKDQNYRKLREAWWNANRQKVWEVITCSARSNDLLIKRRWTTSKQSGGENKLELCRKCGHYEAKVPTQLDYIPQLLRWLTEWIEDFYREKQKLMDDIGRHCKECTTEDGKCKVDTSYSSTCKDKCKNYCECMKKWKSEWENQKNKYKELYEENKRKPSPKNTSGYDDYVKDVFNKLEEDNYSSLDKHIKNDPYFVEYATKLSFILNSSDGNNVSGTSSNDNDEASNCNESEIASFEEPPTSVPSSQKACNIYISIKPNKKKVCKDVKLSINNNDRVLKMCVIEDDFLRGVENCCCKDLLRILQENCSDNKRGSSYNGSCDKNSEDECQKNLEKVVASLQNSYKCEKCKSGTSTSNNKWVWKKFTGKEGGLQEEYVNTIGLPPRTQSLCLVCLHDKGEKRKDKNISTNSELLKECIIAAFHEGKNLKRCYSQIKNGENNIKLCKALAYSFADYGDLIKGTSIWDNDFTKNLELNLQKTFGNLFRKYIKKNIGTEQNTLYSSLAELRESWWNTNKKYIWLSMKHGAGINSTTCSGSCDDGSTTCSDDNGSRCDDMPTIDLIPQYLRFLQEWVEHFCKQRQGKVKDVINSCNLYKDISGKTKIEEKCKTECKNKCEEYKKFIEDCSGGGSGTAGSPWGKRWDQIYKRYSKHIEDAKRNLEAGTKTCGTTIGASKCVQSDIDSFFKHLIDIGLTTPSSYLSIVLDDKICGEDNAPWITYTTYTTTKNCDNEKKNPKSQPSDSTVVVNIPSPLSNTPHGYKYACECRRPSTQESCDDRKEYMNQWNCDNTKNKKDARYRNSDYKLCKYNGVEETKPPKKLNNSMLNENDVRFFNLFEDWNKEIQYQIEQYMTNTNISCNKEKKVLGSSSDEGAHQDGSGHEYGENSKKEQSMYCKDKCECYELWMENIKKQWKTQKTNYNKFQTKKINDGNNDPQEKEMVKLSNFLFFSCWEEYIQKHFNGDWSKIKNIGSDTFEFLIKKCGKNSGDGEEIFNKKLKNAEQQCKVTQNIGTNVNPSGTLTDCKGTNYIRGCQSKTYDGFMYPGRGGEKQWICKDTITDGDTNGACIPPRTQNLCVGNLWDKSYGGKSIIKNDTKESLKEKIKNAIQKETELLYEYHDKGTAIISENPMKEGGEKGEGKANNNNSNGLPKGFCHAVQRSFIDYKNMILGTSVNTYEYIGKLQEDINKIIEEDRTQRSGKPVGGTDKVNDWWKEIEKDMWDAVRCGIKTIKKQNNKGTFNGNECGISPPTGNDEDQFVSWFKEWGEQFCIERLQYENDIRNVCTNNGKEKEIQEECKRKCEEYKKYISEKKEEWDKQKIKYENKYVEKSASDLLKENYPECISANFDFIFNDNVEYKTYYPYGDYSGICSCEEVKYYKYNKDQKIINKSICREKGNDMTWSKKYIKKLENGRKLEGVYIPPRRQQLCLYEILPVIIKYKNDNKKAKEELLETLKIVAEREAYYLWKQYHLNSDKDYLAHKKACCAIRGSFYDLGDIIKGNDLVHDEYTKYIDTTLNEIFRGSSENVGNSTKRARTDWWENETIDVDNGTDHKTIRQLVWDAMQSGVRYAIEEKNVKETPPLCMGVEHIGIAKPQFIRWLEEWTNEFCEEYTKYFRAIKSKCDPPKRADNCGDNTNIECKKACANYTNWLNPKRIEWNGMSNYYNKIYRKSNKESDDGEDYSMIMAPTVIEYLNKRCNRDINGNYICCSCKDIGENITISTTQKTKVQKKEDENEEEKGPLDLMNEVLNKMDPKYSALKMKCTEVYLEHIEEQLKEIDNAINDYNLYPLDRCFDDESKMKVCDLIGDAIGCKHKRKLDELEEWNDVDMREPYNKHKGVLIPPRRRQLCFSSIVRGPKNLRNLNEFKKEILKGALSEGKFLGNYYREHKDKEKALEAMKNSFYDYEDIIKGTDMLQNIEFKNIKMKLDKLLDKEPNNTIKAKDWWEANKKSIWNAMLCGYKKSGNKIIDSSWCTIPTTEKPTQFLRWIKEWGTNVCIQKEMYKKNVKSKCSNVTNNDLGSETAESKNCTSEITKYQEWSKKRSAQWEAISEKYKKYKSTNEFKNAKEPDANEYLKEHCSKCPCGYNDIKEITNYTNIEKEEFKQIKEKVDIPSELEDVIYRIKYHKYDNDNNYICKKYKNISVNMKKNNDTIWTDDLVKNSSEINKGVLIPPRRRNLFLNIKDSEICKYKKNPKMFKDFIYSSAISEVQRLRNAYGGARAKVAHAMKYSFCDIGSIIKGDDMMEKNSSDKIGKILVDEDGKKGNRKKWWDSNKYHIWESMLCGYKNAYGKFSDDVEKIREMPNNDDEHQFLRWFTEWAEDFCIKQTEELKKLGKICNFGTCDNATRGQKSECQKSCNTYKKFLNKWEEQYLQQYSKYDSLEDTVPVIKEKQPYIYLKDTCENRCSCLHKRDGIPVNNAFVYPPKEVEGKCPCPIKGAIIPPKETTTTKTRKSEKTRQLYTDNHLEKCPFENSGDGTTTTVINNDSCKNLNLNRQCIQNEYKNNLDQWKGSIVKNMSDENKGVLVPPRRRHLCRTPVIGKIYRSKDEDIFRNDFYIATFNQGYLLGKTFKDYNDEGHEALKNSFADYGDIIKGEDMMETATHTDIKEKLENLLKNPQNTDESNGTTRQFKDVSDWWKTNKTKVWHAMLCGYHQGVTGTQTLGGRRGRQSQHVTAPTSSPTTKIPSNWCELPTDDSTDQFLRWLREWGTQYCKEKEQLKSDINLECKSHLDKYAIIEKKEDIHLKCLEKLQQYEVWSNNRLPQWKGLSEKFTKDTDDKKYTNVEDKSADNYLQKHCSECKCSFNDIEQTHEKSEKGEHDIYIDILDKAQIPSSLEDKAYRYKGLDPKCPEENECSQYENIPCEVLLHDDNKDWESTFVKNNNTTNKGVLVPPRRRQLCLRIDLKKLRQLKKGEENFKKFICSCAFAEAKRLKKVYKQDDNELLQAMKYSFADIGNIVKGDDMMESPTFRYIEEIFSDMKYKGIYRTKWWNKNKYDVWKSMLCGYKKAGGNLSEKSENCRFPDTEAVPQFLRWFQEWTENFCAGRKKLHDKLNSECTSVECTNESVDKSKCTHACEKYKNYVLSKKKEYEIQKIKYNAEFKNKYVIVKEAADYFKNKCKNNCDCLSNKFSDDNKWNEPYNTFDDDSNLKSKCECAKSETERDAKPCTIPYGDVTSQEGESEAATVDGLLDKIKENFWSFVGTAGVWGTYGTYKAIDAAAPVIISEGSKYGEKAEEIVTPIAKNVVTQLLYKLTELIKTSDDKSPAGEIQQTRRGKTQRPLLPPPPPPPIIPPPIYLIYRKNKKKKTTCEIVGEILRGKNENSPIYGCYPKNNDNNYPEWKCIKDSNLVTEDGVCIPPRRQKLCLHYLKQEITDTEGLKNAFVKCAAAETFFLWEKYKKDMNGSADNLDEKLKTGTIPEDFKHQMFYTYGDYRDLCLNTDILSKTDTLSDVGIVKMNIDNFFSTIRQGSPHHRTNWWEKRGRTIWEGMICTLSYNIETKNMDNNVLKNLTEKNKYSTVSSKLEEFAKTPQFFRWFVEWSEDYCRNYKKQLEILQKACNTVDCSKEPGDSEKQICKTACESFKTFVEGWKKQYDYQKNKFNQEKNKDNMKNAYKRIENKEAHEYLADECKGKCECITDKTEYNTNSNDLKVFDIPPSEHKYNCECVLRKKSACANNELPKGRTQSQMTCDDLKNESSSSGNNNNGNNPKGTITSSCNKSNLIGLGAQWKQITDGDPIYVSPRTRQLCLKHLIDIERDNTENKNMTEEQFIKVLQKDAYAEGKLLYMYYNNYGKISIFKNGENPKLEDIEKHTHEAMKRSYADYGDLIKGTTQYTEYTDYNKIIDIIKDVTKTRNTDPSNNVHKRKEFWTKYKADIWNAMLCGYKDVSNKTFDGKDDMCNLPNTDNEEEFLRWFKEWNENFCITQVKRQDKLKNECINYTCSSTKRENVDIKTKCQTACINYKNFIKESNKQYKEQKTIYDEKHMKYKNKDAPDFLKENCINKNCNCISIKFSDNDNWEQSSFDSSDSFDIKNKCDCLKREEESNTIRRYIPKGDSQYHTEYKGDGTVNYKYEKGKPKASPSIYPMNCAEKVADELRMYAENSLDTNTKLKAIEPHGIFETEQNATNNDISCKIHNNTTNRQENTCGNNGKTFHDNDEWDCNKGTNKLYENGICLPPRRKHMCTKQLENISTASIRTTDDLLKEVLSTAINEGERLKQQWEKTENIVHKKKKHFLCEAMKYSFADLADIIRGIDIWKGNSEQKKIQQRLFIIFRNIYDNLGKDEKEKYNYGTKYRSLRSAWWDAHRKEIWNAMTCSAPEDAKLYITRKKSEFERITLIQDKCGHNKEPPVYDYVPQILRWITEWSENFCELQEKNYYLLKENCTDYLQKDSKSIDVQYNMKCNTCKTKCAQYTKFIKKWKSQYNNLEKKFKELYDKANNIENSDKSYRNVKTSRRSHYKDENMIKFLKKVKIECKEPNTVDKYLMYTSDCRTVKFSNTNDTNVNKPTADVTHNAINGPSSTLTASTETDIKNELREYAFLETPEGYESKCTCEITHNPLDECPHDTYKDVCNGFEVIRRCMKKNFNNDLDNWNSYHVEDLKKKNAGVLVPPRRKVICFTNMISKNYEKEENGMETFKTDLLQVAYTEGYFLCKKYEKDHRDVLEAMKYTFADIADIVKGTDMINNVISTKLGKLLDNEVELISSTKWWENNRKRVWNAMLCGYKMKNENQQLNSSWCSVPNEDETPQFLRWLKEWGRQACKEKKSKARIVLEKCNTAHLTEDQKKNPSSITGCKNAAEDYMQWIYNTTASWKILSNKYENDRTKNDDTYTKLLFTSAKDYLKIRCNDCDCNLDDFDETYNEGKSLADDMIIEAINKAKRDLPNGGWGIYWDDWRYPTWNAFKWPSITLPDISFQWIDSVNDVIENVSEQIKMVDHSLSTAISIGTEAKEKTVETARKFLDKVLQIRQGITRALENMEHETETNKLRTNIVPESSRDTLPSSSNDPIVGPYGPKVPSFFQNDYLSLATLFNVLTYSAPLRIGLLLGSIAFLFFYLKKKSELRPTKIFRVIDIPQNDYDMSTTESSNRYVPYESDRYKGKTYIYMEGEETDDYSYIRDISSYDITSSSESEYEELDINDIYVPSLPKYKTFIELVLEPSKRDTFNTPSGDTFTNKLTDDEWKQLKQDFIEQNLTHIGPSLPLYNELPDDNMYMDTQPNILHDSMDEKPFITQIQDRFLDSCHEEVTYNIDWNVPENINRITNIMDDPKYSSNNMYTGTDLINDSLNGNQHMDIYHEMLKRKENELFGTNHTQNTTFNSVSKQTPGDPIINQLDLYHNWMDKHRDICEQWKTKEDMLYKLNEVWNMERKEYLLDIQPSNLDDIHKINDETYNIISTNNIYDHPSQETSLQPLGSTNIIPSYITREQNNGLRTNISMDIHIEEKNNNNVVTTSIIGDDQVENSYNFG